MNFNAILLPDTRLPLTLDQLDLVRSDLCLVEAESAAIRFYDNLFDAAPAARSLFPKDLSHQRDLLITELTIMAALATRALVNADDGFERRARRLGRRHAGYGATREHYELVGATLLSALAPELHGWDRRHETAWRAFYDTVSTAMLEAALAEAVALDRD
ncbi:MAG: globin domain-containing protein [Ilumatobacter sp.]